LRHLATCVSTLMRIQPFPTFSMISRSESLCCGELEA
jgi:hypothetical protein